MYTVALGTAAPVGSVTRPRRSAANPGEAAAAIQIHSVSRKRVTRHLASTGENKVALYTGIPAMTPQHIISKLQQRFGNKITAAFVDDKHPRVHVDAADWREVAEFLVADPELKLDWLACHAGVDYVADEKMACVHDLWSFDHRHSFAVKVFTPRDKP